MPTPSPDIGPPSARLTRALKGLQFNPRTGAMAGVSADVARSAGADLPSTPGTSAADEFMSRMRSPSVADRISMGLEAAAPIFNPRSESTGQAFVGSALQAFAGGQQIQRSRALNSLLLQMQMARAGLDARKTQAQTDLARSRSQWFDTEAAGGGPAGVEAMRAKAQADLGAAHDKAAMDRLHEHMRLIAAMLPTRKAGAERRLSDQEVQQAESRYRPAYQAGVKAVQSVDEQGNPIFGRLPRNLAAPHSGPGWEAATALDPRFKADSALLSGQPLAPPAPAPRGQGTVLQLPRGATPTPGSLPGLALPQPLGPATPSAPAAPAAAAGAPEGLEARLGEDELEHLGTVAGGIGATEEEIRARLAGQYHPDDVEEIVRRAAKVREEPEDDETGTAEPGSGGP